MARCVSWRPATCPKHTMPGLPGACRTCWRPCRSKVEHRGDRCTDCEVAIAQSPSTDVKLALLHEDDISDDVLDYLTSDSDPTVAEAALELEAHRAELEGARGA